MAHAPECRIILVIGRRIGTDLAHEKTDSPGRELIDRVSPDRVPCDRCKTVADRQLLTGVHVLPPDGNSRLSMLCEGCASFVDAAIDGRPVFARGRGDAEPTIADEMIERLHDHREGGS